jgi:6-phosphogluconate dehydrogenase
MEEHSLTVYDIDAEAVKEASNLGADPANSLKELALKLDPPRVIWIMVPAGGPVDDVINGLAGSLEAGDILIDGGNSHYKDSKRRAEELNAKSIFYLDVGTSGGLEGAEKGASLTVGGSREAYVTALPLLRSVARSDGILYCGPSGAGHYVKMVHNAVEYIMLQGLGEGFELLEKGPYKLDLEAVARVWNNGCVIRSWMLELAAEALSKDPHLGNIVGEVGGGETGQWALIEALESGTPAPALALSLMMRYRSRQEDSFTGKMVAAIRNEFGGHPVKLKK